MGSFLRAKTIKILDGPLKFSLVTSMIFGGVDHNQLLYEFNNDNDSCNFNIIYRVFANEGKGFNF